MQRLMWSGHLSARMLSLILRMVLDGYGELSSANRVLPVWVSWGKERGHRRLPFPPVRYSASLGLGEILLVTTYGLLLEALAKYWLSVLMTL